MIVYLIATAVSVLLGAVAIEPHRYAYWFAKVAPRWIIPVCLAVQAVTYALAGVIVAALIDATGLVGRLDLPNTLVGVVAGSVPHGLAAIPLPRGITHELRNPKSWLGRVLNWITLMLDFRAGKRVTDEVEGLFGSKLIDLTWHLYWNSYFTDSSVPEATKTVQYDLLKKGEHQIVDGTDVADGTGRLRNFCIGEIRRRSIS